MLTPASEDGDILNSYHLEANSNVRKPVAIDGLTAAGGPLGGIGPLLTKLLTN